MRDLVRGLGYGLLGGAVGLIAMELSQRLTRPMVKSRERRPMDVFLTERTISPFGPTHEPGEGPTAALGRIAFTKVIGHPPSERVKEALSWGVHIGYGLLVASLYGALRRRSRQPVRDGLVFGTGLWLFGDEMAVTLLGLQDKPTAYHPTRHLQSLVSHLGFGLATAETARRLEDMR